MNNKQHIAEGAPRIRLVAPTAALASGLLSTAAWSAPGDLDPTFGDVGRSLDWPGARGELWALQPMPDDDLLFSGCGTYYDDCIASGFTGRLDNAGSFDRLLVEAMLGEAVVYDFARQADGKVVAVGNARNAGSTYAIVFRLKPDGTLDLGFGTDGVVRLKDSGYAMEQGSSLVVDSDGRIVIAGLRGSAVGVVRLLTDGAPDTSFGAVGGFTGTSRTGQAPRLVGASGGGYRVLVYPVPDAGPSSRCRVLALTAGGEVDSGYGDSGLSELTAVPTGALCSSIAADASGRTIVAGVAYANQTSAAFVARLLAGGQVDPAFDASQVAASMASVSALSIAADGKIVVAGPDRAGLSGALVSRLQADGRLDEVFGRGGTSRIALPAQWPDNFWINDLQVLGSGAITVGGGAWTSTGGQPFVARLLADNSRGGPGLLGVKAGHVDVRESDGQAVVVLERTAGKSGPVTISYATAAFQAGESSATPGTDFTPVQGQISWADGDDSERQIVVPIVADDAGLEPPESFQVQLSDPTGAGLAVSRATVSIFGDAYPAGWLNLTAAPFANERDGQVLVQVTRADYGLGEVSVAVSVTGGSATEGSDFVRSAPIRLTWRDGEMGVKLAAIPLVDDRTAEPQETIIISLSDPGGGALIGPQRSVTVTIVDEDGAPSAGGDGKGGNGGGGHAGALFAMLSGLATLLRRRRTGS